MSKAKKSKPVDKRFLVEFTGERNTSNPSLIHAEIVVSPSILLAIGAAIRKVPRKIHNDIKNIRTREI